MKFHWQFISAFNIFSTKTQAWDRKILLVLLLQKNKWEISIHKGWKHKTLISLCIQYYNTLISYRLIKHLRPHTHICTLKQEIQDSINHWYVYNYQEKEHHGFEFNCFPGTRSLHRPVLNHVVLARISLGKYKHSLWGFFSLPKTICFPIAWSVINWARSQQLTIVLPQTQVRGF